MGGVNVDTGGKGGKRPTDSEVNMIPMIDFLIVCISFLLITAVWSQMSRINANAQVPGPPDLTVDPVTKDLDKMLTVEMKQDDKFVLIWKSGNVVHATSEISRKGVETTTGDSAQLRYPELSKEIEKQWGEYGTHKNETDRVQDQAIISVDNRTPFEDIISVIDSVYQAKRKFKGEEITAFNVTFSAR